MKNFATDEALTLHELNRLEAQRKLDAFPKSVLETAWAQEAQIEAVIDAVLAVALGADAVAYAHARHVGEWCARISSVLSYGPEPLFARRVGVLCDVDPAALACIKELQYLATFVGEYQACALEGKANPRTIALIVGVAHEFDSLLVSAHSAGSVLRKMLASTDERSRPIVKALESTLHVRKSGVA